MYNDIVDEIVAELSQRNFTHDDIKMCIQLAMNVTERCCGVHWTDKDYYDMFDDVVLALDHPGEKFIRPLR